MECELLKVAKLYNEQSERELKEDAIAFLIGVVICLSTLLAI